MAVPAAGGVDLSRKFVSETVIEEKRKQRQEEWEKVRQPEDPEGKQSAINSSLLQKMHTDTSNILHHACALVSSKHLHASCFCVFVMSP